MCNEKAGHPKASRLAVRRNDTGSTSARPPQTNPKAEPPLARRFPASAAASAGQVAESHQEFVHRAGCLAAFADGPYHQRLTTADVASGEHLGYVRCIAADEVHR